MLSKKTLAVFLISTGVFLLGVSLIGEITTLGSYESGEPNSGEQFDESLVDSIRSVDELIAFSLEISGDSQILNSEQKMILLYESVIDRFTHSSGARHTIVTNWILFFAGKFVYPLGFIWDQEIFLSKGHSLICSQSSYLLMQAALRCGIIARHVGLYGHVVMEAWYDDDWHMFDPDSEVLVKNSVGTVLSVDEISRDMPLLREVYVGRQKKLISIFASREDNSFASYPVGTYFEWKSQVLLYFEKVMQVLKYLIPICFTLSGTLMLLKFSDTLEGDLSSPAK